MNNTSFRFGFKKKFNANKSSMCFSACYFLFLIAFSSCSKDETPIPETNDLMVKLESYTLDPVYPRADRNSTQIGRASWRGRV